MDPELDGEYNIDQTCSLEDLESQIRQLNQRLENERSRQAKIEEENAALKQKLVEVQKATDAVGTKEPAPYSSGTIDETISQFEEQVQQLKVVLTKRPPSSNNSPLLVSPLLSAVTTPQPSTTPTASPRVAALQQQQQLYSKSDSFVRKFSSIKNILEDISSQQDVVVVDTSNTTNTDPASTSPTPPHEEVESSSISSSQSEEEIAVVVVEAKQEEVVVVEETKVEEVVELEKVKQEEIVVVKQEEIVVSTPTAAVEAAEIVVDAAKQEETVAVEEKKEEEKDIKAPFTFYASSEAPANTEDMVTCQETKEVVKKESPKMIDLRPADTAPKFSLDDLDSLPDVPSTIPTMIQSDDSSPRKPVVALNDNIIKEGFLKKKGGGEGGRRNWTTRWFRLKQDTLSYYKKRKDAKPKGIVKLTSARIETHSGKPFGIVLLCGINESNLVRDYLLMAESKKEQEDWIQAITDVIKHIPITSGAPSNATSTITTSITTSHNSNTLSRK
eukprot:gene19515-23378_t